MNQLNCPLYHEKIYSKAGLGCMMCGVPLEYKGYDFCCIECEENYNKINNIKRLKNDRKNH